VDAKALGKKLARDMFSVADEPNKPVTRIQFMSGNWIDGDEEGNGGFCESAAADFFRRWIQDNIKGAEQ